MADEERINGVYLGIFVCTGGACCFFWPHISALRGAFYFVPRCNIDRGEIVGTVFAYFYSMAETFKLKLFGDIYAEETPNKTLRLRRGDDIISHHEYTYVWSLSPKVYALCRADKEKIDIVFSSGQMYMNAFYAHSIGAVGENEDRYLIAVLVVSGTLVLDDNGHYILFIAGYPRIATLYDEFLVVYRPDGITPFVQVYDLDGKLVSEGLPTQAREEARKRLRER
jgi:hypothetical protein